MTPAGRLDPENGLVDLRSVELAGAAQGDGQIKGSNEDAVHTVHGGDLLDALQTARSLALGQQQRLPVAGLHVIRDGGRVGRISPAAVPGGTESAIPKRRVFGVLDQLPDFLHRLHTGNDHALGPHVQQPQDGCAGDLVGPGQSRQAGSLGGGDLGCGGFDAGGRVLRIHDHIVQSRIAQALHRQGIADGGKGPQAGTAFPEFL